MNQSENMRRLIDLARGAKESTTEVVTESSPAKAFSRWGKLDEAWPGEPASEHEKITVYQDKDPMGTGEWMWLKSVDGHVVASGSAPTEEEARTAAGLDECATPMTEEEVHDEDIEEDVRQMIAASIREGNTSGKGMVEGDVNFYWELSVPDSAQFDQIMGGPSEKGGMEDDMDEDFVKDYIANQVEGGFREGHYPTWNIKINMWRNVAEDMLVPPEVIDTQEENDLDEMYQQLQDDDQGPDVTTVTGPSYWASYLVNGDDSSLTPEEKAAADAWNERLGDYYVVGIADDEETGQSQEPRFSNHYDIHSGTDFRGGDVVDYVVHRSHKPVTEEAGGGLHVDYVFDIDDIPEEYRDECISDCSASGDVGQAVEYWRKKLNFTVNRDRAIQCLKGYGAWEPEELAEMDDDEIADKILWLACGNFSEWDGDENGNSASGSPQFVLEAKK